MRSVDDDDERIVNIEESVIENIHNLCSLCSAYVYVMYISMCVNKIYSCRRW